MPRQRSTPWIQRWSRLLIAGLASIGAAVTAYLTYTKFTGNEAACPTSGCDIVLSSPYATVFGQPLALFGLLAYLSMVAFAIAPLLINKKSDLQAKVENTTGLLLFLGSTAMMVFSGYLLYLLAFEIKTVCVYCIASAFLSLSLFILSLIGRDWQDSGQLFFSGAIVGVIVLVGTLGVYANVNNPAIAESSAEQAPGYNITTRSGAAEINLAKHLQSIGAEFYGAYWCPHCHDQKQLFGQEAAQFIPYVECAQDAPNTEMSRCQAANVQSFPTWVINGQTVTGTQSLDELAQLSGYQGNKNFRNSLETVPQ
ncbi:vitamin K epoxide reductase family protein [Microcoleus sp. FACHB-1515]|uniref:vitamin K epoxide reductase family protein n=1 Tax=Cyanophyceae TaxID=3028117 RepID=UPI001684BE76|nr:vitamin K epoxide reductase family protein [Microcoleus sp. FACHB-1515]MBD2093380.1 vitamin K epoxide reductase family protein [Microcoleus sp. FACHB-1515]